MDGVVTVMKSGGQYQVVIGNHVPDVYADVLPLVGGAAKPVSTETIVKRIEIASPMKGKVLQLENIRDEAFAVRKSPFSSRYFFHCRKNLVNQFFIPACQEGHHAGKIH